MSNRANRRAWGFTLVELLIAISITVLIITLLSTVFVAASNQWRSADERIDVFRDARAALQIIARDLSRVDINGAPQMLTLSNPSADGSYAQEAYAVTPVANSGKSDLCAVGYYLDWNSTTKTYTLKRLFKDSDVTTSGLHGTSLDLTGLFTKDPANDEDLAAYIWDLEFRPGELADPVTPTTDTPAEWRWVQVKFKAMSPNAARKLKGVAGFNQAVWADPTLPLYKTLILPSEQQFVTRVWLLQNR